MSNKVSYEDQLHAIQRIMSDDLINFIKNNADDAIKVRQQLQEDNILVDGEISDKHQKMLDLRLAGADSISEASRMEDILVNAVKVSSGTDAERNSVMNLTQGNYFNVFLENAAKQWGFSYTDKEENKFSQNEIAQQLAEYDTTLEASSGFLNKHHRVYTAKYDGLSIVDVISNEEAAVSSEYDIDAMDLPASDQQHLEDVMALNSAKLSLMSIAARFEEGDAYTTLDFNELSNNYMASLHKAGLGREELSNLSQLPGNMNDMNVDKLQMIRDLIEPLNDIINEKTTEIQSDSVALQAQDFTDNHNELFKHSQILQRMDETIAQSKGVDNSPSIFNADDLDIKSSIVSMTNAEQPIEHPQQYLPPHPSMDLD